MSQKYRCGTGEKFTSSPLDIWDPTLYLGAYKSPRCWKESYVHGKWERDLTKSLGTDRSGSCPWQWSNRQDNWCGSSTPAVQWWNGNRLPVPTTAVCMSPGGWFLFCPAVPPGLVLILNPLNLSAHHVCASSPLCQSGESSSNLEVRKPGF